MSAGASRRHISELDHYVNNLPGETKALFERLFHLGITVGELNPPETMYDWIAGHFGSVENVRRQRIVKVTNRITLEGALFNDLRARRPLEAPSSQTDLERTISEGVGGPFCNPKAGTPADLFGRVRGQHTSTASNIAKYDGWHAVVILDEHHPLHLTGERIADCIDTGQKWAQIAHQVDPEANYPFFIWNCLWRSGASILHGHAQMTLTRGMHYASVEGWRQAALRYGSECGANYFDDLIATYRELGLAATQGTATIFPSLTPFKEKETLIIGPRLDNDLKSALSKVLHTFLEQLGVQSFNLALYQPPLGRTPEDWSGFPFIFRILDRGDLGNKTSDVGAMELFGQSVIATDPFRVAEALQKP
jgi:galactose-1-phosphate uridylyltransferase